MENTPNVSSRTFRIKIKGLESIYKQAQEIKKEVKEKAQEVADQEENKDQTMSSIDDGASLSMDSENLEEKAADQEENEKVDDSDNKNNNNNSDHVCVECNKSFSTNKKLHGHMRVHPDRSYRGMVPPEGKVIKNRNSQPVSRKKELKWGNMFQRGRIGSSSNPQPPRPSDAEGWMSFHPINDLDNESEEDQAAVILQMISEYETDYSVSLERASSLLTGILEYYQEEGCHKRLKITEFDDEKEEVQEQVVEEKKEYTCQTCNRSFSTHQALGGHRASHSKVRNSVEEGESSEKGKQQVNSGQEIHQCKHCPAFYTCGQALGGHMRKHFLEEQALEAPVKAQQSPRVSNLDLNVKPCDEEEEGGREEGGAKEE
ncbi:beta-beta-alpha zinc fingers domain-containing protein [Dioscorea alata]|uniref:Beta-beta-alpha zinc fingers domain-containing protein n=1 Tax=Dioscorea alata TaxID=55571 RepID=A0ACB7VJ76_DIOAL|nr:beta-beta-alpha zinc fingers domain-containing protein [Dioscorea alata]